MKTWVFVVAFLLVGSFVIVNTNNLDVKEGGDRSEFFFRFVDWVFDLGGNMKDIAGYAVKMDWLPENEDNSTKIP